MHAGYPPRRGRGAARRARRRARAGRRRVGAADGGARRVAADRSARRRRRRRAGAALEGPQVRVLGGRTASARTSSSRTAWCRGPSSARRSSPSSSCRPAHGLRVANVFHAGDGNLHPLILYDGREAGALERAEALAADILRLCIRLGGSITGEHGVGLEKRAFLPRDVPARGHRVHAAAAPVDRRPRARQSRQDAGCRRPPLMTLTPRSSGRAAGGGGRVGARRRWRIRGGGTKRLAAAPRRRDPRYPRSWPASSTYNPAECVVTALAGTPVRRHRAPRSAAHGQYLPFDPPLARRRRHHRRHGRRRAERPRPLSLRRRPRLRHRRARRRRRGPPRFASRRPGGEERRRVPAAPRAGRQRRPLRRHRRDVLQGVSPARGAAPRCAWRDRPGATRSMRHERLRGRARPGGARPRRGRPTPRGPAWRGRPPALPARLSRIRDAVERPGGTRPRRRRGLRAWHDAARVRAGRRPDAPLVKLRGHARRCCATPR